MEKEYGYLIRTIGLLKKENYSEELVKEVVKDIVSNSEYKLGKIKLLFERYKFTNYSDFEERFMKYEDIVLSDFSKSFCKIRLYV